MRESGTERKGEGREGGEGGDRGEGEIEGGGEPTNTNYTTAFHSNPLQIV